METDNLKNTWLALDERLKKQEMLLNDYLIKEMLRKKYNKSLNRLSNFEWIGLIVIILVLPVPLWAVFTVVIPLKLPVMWLVCYLGLFLLLLYSLGSCAWKIYTLAKVDLSKPLSDNVRVLNRYNIFMKREMVYINVLILPPSIYILVDAYRMVPSVLPLIVALFFFVIASLVVSVWIYKKFTKHHLNSIRESLVELKDLDEM